MPISLQKGQKVDLTKGNAGLNNLMVGLGWDVNSFDNGTQFDLDASVFLLGENSKITNPEDFMFYGNKTHSSSSVELSGDNLTGEGSGDDETIKINLSKIPASIDKIVFSVTIYEAETRKQNFGQVNNAYIRVVDDNTNTELITFDLDEDFSIETAVVVAELYRHNGEWKFNAVGNGFNGGLAALCTSYGVELA